MSRAKTKSENERARSASIRAAAGYASVTRAAKRLTEEMDEVTANHGIPVTDLSDEDSMVVSVTEMIAQARK